MCNNYITESRCCMTSRYSSGKKCYSLQSEPPHCCYGSPAYEIIVDLVLHIVDYNADHPNYNKKDHVLGLLVDKVSECGIVMMHSWNVLKL